MRVTYRCCGACPDGTPVFEATGARFCCGEMSRYWGRLIGFGAPGRRSTDREVNLVSAVPQRGGRSVASLAAVQFCPWCGEPVETYRAK